MSATPLRIDFVSDVACPWCAVGLAALEEALRRTEGDVAADLHFEPYELNPDMGAEGVDATEYIAQKYGASAEQQAATWAQMRARGAALGFAFNPEGRGRIWNTFDAHRLLFWAGTLGGDRQLALKKALLAAYHGRAEHVADADVLVRIAEGAGLDGAEARGILASTEYAPQVRARERHWQGLGIQAVPSVVINGQHLVQGGQPPEAFEQALRQIAAMPASAHASA